MGLRVVVDGARQLDPGIWLLDLAPHQVQLLGECRDSRGQRSILMVDDPEFDSDKGELEFDADRAWPINIGVSSEAVAIAVRREQVSVGQTLSDDNRLSYGPGDQEFLRNTNLLDTAPKTAARKLLDGVRSRSPGDLQRGKRRNFKNTPDNFWYVIVQPQAQALSITVRGRPARFGRSNLELKDDRPGYTRFQLRSVNDVDEALRLIFESRRKI